MSMPPLICCVLLSSLLTVAACSRGGGAGEAPAPEAPAKGTATLSWTAPSTNVDGSPLSGLAGYRIYYGTDPDNLDHQVAVTDPAVVSWTVSGLAPGTWYFAVTAVGPDGAESAPSPVGSKTIQ